MTATVESFESTFQKTNSMLKEIADELGWDDHHRAYLAFRAVLHALRDRLTVEEAAHFAAQLPMLVRGFYYEGWHPAGKPVKERDKDEFLGQIHKEIPGTLDVNDEQIARAVFGVLLRHVTKGEIADVQQSLPSSIRELWPEKVSV